MLPAPTAVVVTVGMKYKTATVALCQEALSSSGYSVTHENVDDTAYEKRIHSLAYEHDVVVCFRGIGGGGGGSVERISIQRVRGPEGG
jgi:hypothetical protein